MFLTTSKRKREIGTDVSNSIPIEIDLIQYDATIIFVQDDRKKKARGITQSKMNSINLYTSLFSRKFR